MAGPIYTDRPSRGATSRSSRNSAIPTIAQLTIEKAVQKAVAEGRLKGNEAFPAAMTLTVGKLAIDVKFDGEIRLE